MGVVVGIGMVIGVVASMAPTRSGAIARAVAADRKIARGFMQRGNRLGSVQEKLMSTHPLPPIHSDSGDRATEAISPVTPFPIGEGEIGKSGADCRHPYGIIQQRQQQALSPAYFR